MDVNLLKLKLLSAVDKLKHCQPSFQYAVAAIVAGFLLTFISPLYDFFSLNPYHVFNFNLWKLITCSFFEPNLLVLIFEIVVAYQFYHLIEPVWGYAEAFKYAAIVQLITPICIAILGFLSYAAFWYIGLYYDGNLNGLASLAGAVLVAIKQFLPDTVLIPTPMGRIKNNNLPGIAASGAFILWIFGLVRGVVTLQILFGVQIGWTYLRFFQAQHDTNELGDFSEHFAWATLWPRRAQPFAVVFGKVIYRTLTRAGICKRKEYTGFESFVPVDVVFPSTENRDAERRRQKALRDLNERLGGRIKSSPSIQQPATSDVLAPPEVVVVPNQSDSKSDVTLWTATSDETPESSYIENSHD
uniref:DUF1751 domain-containing protein n=1 Tax=Panagrellus redivivus TaxID=6233 RepID=A0A7E4URX8_PANRE